MILTIPAAKEILPGMRRLPIFLAAILAPFAVNAMEDPPDAMIVAMAQHLVQDRLMDSYGTVNHHIKFDLAYLYSRPRKMLWVVVGGFVSNQDKPNSFTSAVMLDCPDFNKVECWSLEKLSINGQIVLDHKRI